MAAVPRKGTAAKKAVVPKKATQTKAAPKGLQLSSQQFKAFNAAANATSSRLFRQLAILATANSIRNSRLKAVYSQQKKLNARVRTAQAARAATFAAKMSYVQSRNGHQNAALKARVLADYQRHVTLLGRQEFALGGQKKFLHTAVMRTVDDQQALAIANARFAAAARSRNKAVRSVSAATRRTGSSITSAQKAQIAAQANAAGLRAALKTPKGRTAASPSLVASPAGHQAWIGRPDTPDCVTFAIANHLLYSAGTRMDDDALALLSAECRRRTLPRLRRRGPSIALALQVARELFRGGQYGLLEYQPAPGGWAHLPGLIIGYESEYGPHAALSLGNGRVISWGQEIPGDAETEEAWLLEWAAG